MRRQQTFLASLAKEVLSKGTLANPATLSELIDVLVSSDNEHGAFSRREPFEQRDGVRRIRQSGDFFPQASRGQPIGRIRQHGGYGLTNGFRRGLHRVEHLRNAQYSTAGRVLGADRHPSGSRPRQAVRQRTDHAARPAM